MLKYLNQSYILTSWLLLGLAFLTEAAAQNVLVRDNSHSTERLFSDLTFAFNAINEGQFKGDVEICILKSHKLTYYTVLEAPAQSPSGYQSVLVTTMGDQEIKIMAPLSGIIIHEPKKVRFDGKGKLEIIDTSLDSSIQDAETKVVGRF